MDDDGFWISKMQVNNFLTLCFYSSMSLVSLLSQFPSFCVYLFYRKQNHMISFNFELVIVKCYIFLCISDEEFDVCCMHFFANSIRRWQAMYIFDKVLASFLHLTCKNSHKIQVHVNWHTQFRFLTCSMTCEGNKHMSIDILQIEMTRTTRHVTLRWHLERKCRCQVTFNFKKQNVTWQFGFEVERQMKIVKHTHW